jgi:predicted aminopeptidase
MHNLRIARCLFCLLALILPCAGCEFDYFAQLIGGESTLLLSTTSVDAALNDPRLTDDERGELLLTQDVRQYGIDTLGMTAGNAFTTFVWDGNGPAAYILAASAKDSLTPYVWFFPFVGLWEAKGYFDEGMARREAQRLSDQGYDIYLGQAEGFSTLGFLPDPIRQSNLQSSDEIDLAELILHEMTHSTVIKPSDIDFSESLATFLGRSGAQAWFNDRFGAGSAEALTAHDRFADKAVIDEFVVDLIDRMTAYYADAAAQGVPRDLIIANREAEFAAARIRYETDYRPRIIDQERWGPIGETTFNNAMLLTAIRYQGWLSDYQTVLDELEGDFPAAIEVYRQAAAVDDSRQFLRDWAAAH